MRGIAGGSTENLEEFVGLLVEDAAQCPGLLPGTSGENGNPYAADMRPHSVLQIDIVDAFNIFSLTFDDSHCPNWRRYLES